jgi:hypothetical protein
LAKADKFSVNGGNKAVNEMGKSESLKSPKDAAGVARDAKSAQQRKNNKPLKLCDLRVLLFAPFAVKSRPA